MRQETTCLTFATSGPGITEITGEIAQWLAGTDVASGVVTLLCRHTSASLLITENASPAVHQDIGRWLTRLAPEGGAYEHDDEGPDDMPAHLKALLTAATLTIPLAESRMMLGTWQGVFLAEHRAHPHRREIAVHVIGESAKQAPDESVGGVR